MPARAVPHHSLPDVVIERRANGRWLWTAASLAHTEKVYQESLGFIEGTVEKLPASLRRSVLGVELWQYIAILGIFLIGVITRSIIHFVVANRIRRLADKLKQNWAIKLVDVIASPGATLVMALVLGVSYPHLMLPMGAAAAMSIAVRMLLVISVVWAIYYLVDLLAERMAEKAEETESKLDDQLVPLVRKAMKIIIVLAGILFILSNLNVNIGSLLAGLGIGGIAVALAAKDTIANFFGSIMIFVDRPFQIGDWVVVEGIEGVVEDVGFRSTRIRTFYNSLVTIPNAKFTEASIDNFGQRTFRRTVTTLNLTYSTSPDQLQAFVEGIRAIIRANSYTRKDYYEVHMSGFGAHSLDVMVYFFFKVQSWTEELKQRHNVYLEILRLAAELKVDFAFPTQTLHVASLAAPRASQPQPQPLPRPQLAPVIQAFGPGGARSQPETEPVTGGYFALSNTVPSGGESE